MSSIRTTSPSSGVSSKQDGAPLSLPYIGQTFVLSAMNATGARVYNSGHTSHTLVVVLSSSGTTSLVVVLKNLLTILQETSLYSEIRFGSQ